MAINRRGFIGLAAGTGLATVLPAAAGAQASPANILSVGDFGADATGQRDCTAAVRKAIAALPASGGVLSFPVGTYRFAASNETAMSFRKLKSVEFRGNGSQLLFDGSTRPMEIDDCTGFTLRDFSVDWVRQPYSQGRVVEAGDTAIVVEIDPEFPVTGNEVVQAIGDYDPVTRWPMVNGVDSYHGVKSVELVAPQRLRLTLKTRLALQKGSTVVLRHGLYEVNGFSIHRSADITFAGVTLFAMPGMGVLAVNTDGLKFDGFRTIIKPGSGRLMSLCADSIHLTDCRGAVEVVNCQFEGMGDDAINICASYFTIQAKKGARSLTVDNGKGVAVPGWRLPLPGSTVQICKRADERVLGVATVAGEHGIVDARLDLQGDLPASVETGDVVCGSQSTTRTTVRNSIFTGNRARGILVHTNAEITGNTFTGCSLAAILMAADGFWLEGPTVSGVSIVGNTFSGCYYAHGNDRRGTITLDTAHDRPRPATPSLRVNHNVVIAGNTFLTSNGAAIYCAGVSDLRIEGNDLGHTDTLTVDGPGGAVVLRNATQVLVKNNRVPAAASLRLIDCPEPIQQEHNGLLTLTSDRSAKDEKGAL